MLDANLTAQLRTHLERLTLPIELVASIDDSPKSAQLRDLLDEIAQLSPMITTSHAGTDTRVPSFEIRRSGTDIAVQFAGIPLGHEFTSLVLALLHVGGHPSKATQDTIAAVQLVPGTLPGRTQRFSITMDVNLVAQIDAVADNRSALLSDAARNEVARRRQAAAA